MNANAPLQFVESVDMDALFQHFQKISGDAYYARFSMSRSAWHLSSQMARFKRTNAQSWGLRNHGHLVALLQVFKGAELSEMAISVDWERCAIDDVEHLMHVVLQQLHASPDLTKLCMSTEDTEPSLLACAQRCGALLDPDYGRVIWLL